MRLISYNIMPLVVNCLRGGHIHTQTHTYTIHTHTHTNTYTYTSTHTQIYTHAHINTHTDFPDKSNFKKPDSRWPQ